jgi:hypothetical protein
MSMFNKDYIANTYLSEREISNAISYLVRELRKSAPTVQQTANIDSIESAVTAYNWTLDD